MHGSTTLLWCWLAYQCVAAPREWQKPLGNSHSNHGAVACENQHCSQVGTSMILDGGSAADALVATVLCIGVIDSYHSGIGGGGFALVHRPNGTFENVDFREAAPVSAHEDMFEGNFLGSLAGGLARCVAICEGWKGTDNHKRSAR